MKTEASTDTLVFISQAWTGAQAKVKELIKFPYNVKINVIDHSCSHVKEDIRQTL